MKIKHSGIVFVIVVIAFVFNNCATIPVRKPLPEEFGDNSQIPGIPRAKFWGDEVPFLPAGDGGREDPLPRRVAGIP